MDDISWTLPVTQIALWNEWIEELQLPIPYPRDVLRIIPPTPREAHCFVALTPRLPALGGVSGAQRTFDLLCRVLGYRYPASTPPRLFVRDMNEVGFRWSWHDIDPTANLSISSSRFGWPSRLPGAGVLAGALLHAEWLRAMRRANAPLVWAPAYGVQTRTGGARLCIAPRESAVTIRVVAPSDHHPRVALPLLRRVIV